MSDLELTLGLSDPEAHVPFPIVTSFLVFFTSNLSTVINSELCPPSFGAFCCKHLSETLGDWLGPVLYRMESSNVN